MSETTHDQSGIITKVRVVETFISKVGIPSLIVLVILGSSVATFFGYADPPVVTKSSFQSHVLANDQIHDAMIKNSTANTEALRQITAELRELRLGMKCDRKPNDREKLRCYQELNGASD